MGLVEGILQEFDQEAQTTRRVLERVPGDQLAWKPHPKSMSLGQLALHVAASPGFIVGWLPAESTEFPDMEAGPPQPKSIAEVFTAFDQSVAAVRGTLGQLGDAGLQGTCSFTKNGAPVMSMPKMGVVRTIILNHSYHHRGQLSVYLRMLNVPVPSIYGPSADENPFAVARA
jgi:uncharacterized damage-inducible protein DinB